eukprot:42651-Eustigmatos_ZCMA.PRE.1
MWVYRGVRSYSESRSLFACCCNHGMGVSIGPGLSPLVGCLVHVTVLQLFESTHGHRPSRLGAKFTADVDTF